MHWLAQSPSWLVKEHKEELPTSQFFLLCNLAQPHTYTGYWCFLSLKNTEKQICAILKENALEIPHAGLSLTLEHDWQNTAISHNGMRLPYPRRVPFQFLSYMI